MLCSSSSESCAVTSIHLDDHDKSHSSTDLRVSCRDWPVTGPTTGYIAVAIYATSESKTIAVTVRVFYIGFSHLLESPGSFFLNVQGHGQSWKMRV